jgi:hypothetical protein
VIEVVIQIAQHGCDCARQDVDVNARIRVQQELARRLRQIALRFHPLAPPRVTQVEMQPARLVAHDVVG